MRVMTGEASKVTLSLLRTGEIRATVCVKVNNPTAAAGTHWSIGTDAVISLTQDAGGRRI